MPKQVIVHSSITAAEIVDIPIPTPKDKQVVIKVAVSGSNPKDFKHPLWKGVSLNSGDDIAGTVHSVGKDVYEFKPGDRVAAFHQVGTTNGSFAEYAVAPDWTTFHIPHHVSFEEAATIPLAAQTAGLALYDDMRLPTPYDAERPAVTGKTLPILIYGVTSAVGAFAAQFARLSGLRPIIGVAGRSGEFAKTLVDYVVDYRMGEDALVAAIVEILAKEGLGTKVPYAFDAISEGQSLEVVRRLIDPNGGTVAITLPPRLFANDKENFEWPSAVRAVNSNATVVHSTRKDFGYVWSRYLGRMLEDGRLKGHPYEVIPGGLKGVLPGLQKLRDGKASGVKYVFRIEETGDLEVGWQGKPPVPPSGETKPHPLSNFPFPAYVLD